MNTAKRKILCIEDDLESAHLIAEELTDMGYAVSLAHDGAEGFAAILRDEPDLVLCDVSMPVMTGFELLERITGLAPRFADMPFIFVTALGQRDAELKGRRLGADDYVTKPVDFEILGTIIETRLARVKRVRPSAPAAALSEREIEILAWSSRGKTSGEIASILGLSKRTVDFHINNAREKLGVATRIEAVIKAAASGIIKP
jgi:DNA-binding NarL/FixJ family response regulator